MKINYNRVSYINKSNNNLSDNKKIKISSSDNIELSQKMTSQSFCANPNRKFLEKTLSTVDEMFINYKNSLGIIPFSEFKSSVDRVSKATNSSKKEVLSTMQQLTQYAEIRSLDSIDKTLKQYGVEYIGNGFEYFSAEFRNYWLSDTAKNFVYDDIGLHDLLNYTLKRKKISRPRPAQYKKANVGIILDDKKISQLEELKEKSPDEFKLITSYKKVKFFMLSGWDSGITFVDRTKNLEDETISLINKARKNCCTPEEEIDAIRRKRIHDLGINYIVIKNEGEPSLLGVYNQITPEKMTKSEFINLIEANSKARSSENIQSDSIIKNKDIAVNAVKSTLDVYSPYRLSSELKRMHSELLNLANKEGKTEDDIIYVIADDVLKTYSKSQSYIMYNYKKVNNIPDNKIYELVDIERDSVDTKDKIVVMLDDCTISGNSIGNILGTKILSKKCKKAEKVIFACVTGTEKARKTFSSKSNCKNQKLFVLNDIKAFSLNKKNKDITDIIGSHNYGAESASCVIFPYMTPDNNYELAVNISMLHNVNFRTSKLSTKSGNIRAHGIKNINPDVQKVLISYIDEIGHLPVPIADIKEVNSENNKKSFLSWFKQLFKN